MKRISILLLLFAGCATDVGSLATQEEPEQTTPQSTLEPEPQPEPVMTDPIIVPVEVPVPIPVAPTNLDLLRLSCPTFSDSGILDFAGTNDDDWWAGVSLASASNANAQVCGFDSACLRCLEAITDFVYLIEHAGDIQPTGFVPGDLFSFLTQDETELFLLSVQNANREIDSQVQNKLSRELFELGSLRGTTLACAVICGAERDRVRLKREATTIAVQQILNAIGVVLNFSAFAEIEDFNCREYPNRSFDCDLSGFGLLLPGLTCTIDLPCR